MTDYVGRTLGPYRLEVLLGKGGMATVYRAYQVSVKRYVAIKVMSPEIAAQPGFVERFDREAQVIASLEHPHILPVIDYGTDEGVHYLVMRYIEGGSLEDRIRKSPLTLEESSRFLTQIASALNYAHTRGVIHRDLKPNNVLLDASENAYLTDFGIARLAQTESKLTATGSVMGTPAYMSPEQGMGSPVDARSDIYALGIVLYEMVLNRLPFSADTPAAMIFQHVYEKPVSPRQIRPDLSDGVVMVLDKAMAKNPDNRYQAATELAGAFAEAISPRRSARKGDDAADSEATFVGGPMEAIPSRGTTPPRVSPAQGTPVAPMAPVTASPTTGQVAQTLPPQNRTPIALIIGGVVIAVALIAGAFAIISSNNNNNIQSQTQTAVAVLAQAASPSPTLSLTPAISDTPNPTLTAMAGQLSTVAAFQANQTATVIAQATGNSNATSAQSAQIANATMTAMAGQLSTVAAFQANQTATAIAQVTANSNATSAQSAQIANATMTAITGQLSTVAAFQANQTATAVAQATANSNATNAQAAQNSVTKTAIAQAQATTNAVQANQSATAVAQVAVNASATSIQLTQDANKALLQSTQRAFATNFVLTSAAQQTLDAIATSTPTSGPNSTETPTLELSSTPNETLAALNDLMKTNVAVSGATDIAASTSNPQPTSTPNGTLTSLNDLMKTNVAAGATEAVTTTTPTPFIMPSDPYLGKPDTVITQLVKEGKLTSSAGSVAATADQIDIQVPKPNWDSWSTVHTPNDLTDFVMSVEMTWNAPDVNNDCGVLFRFNPESSQNAGDETFYTFAISRQGVYQSWVRDKTGYRNNPTLNLASNAIQTADGATNHLLVIGQGGRFRTFINGRAAGTFTDSSYKQGGVAVVGGRYQASTGLTCTFRNLWVYGLSANAYLGQPADVIAQLVHEGKLNSSAGSLVIAVDQMDVDVPKANWVTWTQIGNDSALSDFVISAEMTWDAPDENNECGLIFRYSPASSTTTSDWTYYSFTLTRAGYYSAWVHDKTGYRNNPIVNLASSAIHPDDGATNHLLIIGQGSRFRVFVNGQPVANFLESTYKTGTFAAVGGRFVKSASLTCHFHNIWLYSLKSTGAQ